MDDGWPPPLFPSSFNNLFNVPPHPFTDSLSSSSSLNLNNNLSSQPIQALTQEPHQLVDNQDINWVSLFAGSGGGSCINNNGGGGSGDQECSTSTNLSTMRLARADKSGDGGEIEAAPARGGRVGRRAKKVVPPRVAFHTRSANDILDDGYKWRKYGQKAVKNSMYPRSYYHCTRHTCHVKKQIQRLMKDPGIVVTTYEGHHNHPCEQLMETLSPLLKQIQFLAKF